MVQTSLYDNFIRRGWSKQDCHGRLGSNGRTLEDTLKDKVWEKRHNDGDLGARTYKDLRASHPRTQEGQGLPDAPADAVVEAGLAGALRKDTGVIMRVRAQVVAEFLMLEPPSKADLRDGGDLPAAAQPQE